jgi:phage terminase small subunit
MKDDARLTKKQQQYVQHLASGMESRQAARLAGYSESFSRVAAHRLKGKPEVMKAIEHIQTEGMKLAIYDLATAMREAQEVIDFAKKHKNSMAYFKAVQHRADLSGLLIDRVEIATVDLTGALAKAEARVVHGNDLPGSGKTSIDWKPRIPGSKDN